MTLRLLICAFLATLAVACIEWLTTDPSELVLFYEKHLRGNLFAGFLTVGGFLLSLKTFILIKLKENVYDHKEYRKIYREQKELDSSLRKRSTNHMGCNWGQAGSVSFQRQGSSVSRSSSSPSVGNVSNTNCRYS